MSLHRINLILSLLALLYANEVYSVKRECSEIQGSQQASIRGYGLMDGQSENNRAQPTFAGGT